jgi:rhodanese-related sulfurtransferase
MVLSGAETQRIKRPDRRPEGRKDMIRITLTFLLTILGSIALAGEPQSTEAPSISAAELHDRRTSGDAPTLIDVRTPAEYAAGHIPGAINIPFDEVAERIAEVDAPHGVALYCMIGPRARKGESALLAAGYESVFHLEGGFAAWREAGFPIQRTK